MASERFCGVYRPHDSHEWYEEAGMVVGGAIMGSYFRCWGVKPAPEIAMAIEAIEAAKAKITRMEEELAEIATPHLRTEAEFYLGDGAKDEEWG